MQLGKVVCCKFSGLKHHPNDGHVWYLTPSLLGMNSLPPYPEIYKRLRKLKSFGNSNKLYISRLVEIIRLVTLCLQWPCWCIPTQTMECMSCDNYLWQNNNKSNIRNTIIHGSHQCTLYDGADLTIIRLARNIFYCSILCVLDPLPQHINKRRIGKRTREETKEVKQRFMYVIVVPLLSGKLPGTPRSMTKGWAWCSWCQLLATQVRSWSEGEGTKGSTFLFSYFQLGTLLFFLFNYLWLLLCTRILWTSATWQSVV